MGARTARFALATIFLLGQTSAAIVVPAELTFPDAQGSVQLSGRFYNPPGGGPFPALVLLHGCAGVQPVQQSWAETLVGWGYAALVVDSFTPRGLTNICEKITAVSAAKRASDAIGALRELRRTPLVDGKRIGLVGWSHGGWSALYTVRAGTPWTAEAAGGFRVAVAFYPWCDLTGPFVTRLLLFLGGADDWTPARTCVALARASAAESAPIRVKTYPGAPHGFDMPEPVTRYLDFTYGHHPEAAERAQEKLRRFLARYLE